MVWYHQCSKIKHQLTRSQYISGKKISTRSGKNSSKVEENLQQVTILPTTASSSSQVGGPQSSWNILACLMVRKKLMSLPGRNLSWLQRTRDIGWAQRCACQLQTGGLLSSWAWWRPGGGPPCPCSAPSREAPRSVAPAARHCSPGQWATQQRELRGHQWRGRLWQHCARRRESTRASRLGYSEG